LAYVRQRRDVQAAHVFALGHSEGAIHAMRLAAQHDPVAGSILLAGSARSGEEVLKWQALEIAQRLTGPGRWIVKACRIDVAKSQQKQIDKIKRTTNDWYRHQLVAKIQARWLREYMAYDPSSDLATIEVPVLAITGSNDIQVPPEDLKRMAELITAPFESHVISNLTHTLRRDESGSGVSRYKKQVKRPVDREVLDACGRWLRTRLNQSANVS
jgi:uncharacterized protein